MPKVHHIPSWGSLGDGQRLKVIRHIAMQRGRDPRITTLAVNIIRNSGAQPRDYKAQAAALLAWVQNPKNVYYVNEPGERLQDPLYTLKVRYGDCDDMALLLCSLFEAIKLEWRLVLSGQHRRTGEKKRHIEGQIVPPNVDWAHIYCVVATPPFRPSKWYFCEPTVPGVPLGWDVIDGDHSLLPEMGGKGISKRKANGRFGRSATGAMGMLSGNGIASSVASAVATEAEVQGSGLQSTESSGSEFFGIDTKKFVAAVAIGVATSVISQLTLDEVRAWRSGTRASAKEMA
jgi:hypothetical protein